MPKWMHFGGYIAASLLIVQPTWAQSAATPAKSDAAQRCAALTHESGTALGEPTARILSATLNAPIGQTKFGLFRM